MKNKINAFIIILLLLIGFFFPTSIGSVLSMKLSLIFVFITITLLFILLIINKTNKYNLLIALSINIILLLSTLIHALFIDNLARISWGSYLPFLCLSLLYPLSFLQIKYFPLFKNLFVLINLLNIIIGILIIYDFDSVKDFFIANYSMGYSQLVINMFAFDKPVNMFGSHAIASNMFFILFFVSFQTYIHTKNKFILVLAVADLFLIANLKSVSAYLLLSIGIVQIFLHLRKKYKFFKVISIPAAIFAVAFYIYNPIDKVQSVFSSQHNGFLGRYSNDGVFADTIGYITHNLFPIGLWYSDDLFFTDSGYIVYFLKGSIFMVTAVYLGLFLLIRHNIKNKSIAYTLFGMICLFELGYTNLTYTRMICFMPFILIYLNHLEKEKKVAGIHN